MTTRTVFFFFFNDTATTEIYTLSLHDALPISSTSGPPSGATRQSSSPRTSSCRPSTARPASHRLRPPTHAGRSEEHTSELQLRQYLVCRLLLEKKKKKHI